MTDEFKAQPCPMCGAELHAVEATGYLACRTCSYWEYGTGEDGPRLAAEVPSDEEDRDQRRPNNRFGSARP
jgi:hypothetical protein